MTNGTAAGALSAGSNIVPFVTGRTSLPVRVLYHRVFFRAERDFSRLSRLSRTFSCVGNRSGGAAGVLKALRAYKAHTHPKRDNTDL
jgi:hypothetical protein